MKEANFDESTQSVLCQHTFLYGVSENSVSVLGPHGERSLRVSLVRMLRMAREAGAKLALGARG